jgi:hypothetical protein
MRGDGLVQRLAGWLIGRAGRHLPAAARAEREREWTAELPAILADPDVRSGLLRSARALRFAVGTVRTARREHGVFRGQLTGADARSAGVRLFGCASLWLAAVCLVRLGAVLHIPSWPPPVLTCSPWPRSSSWSAGCASTTEPARTQPRG